ncbi:MAG: cytidylate kinase-like family protein [Synergistaceae bacterium]|nr:cytidylate kinase-like family protein [Synergistaceae bacterium]
MEKRIITISRQFGSGGHEVGMKLAKRLDIKFYDKELVDLLAKDGKYDVDFIEANEEKRSPPMCPIMHGFAMPVFYQDLPSDLIYKVQSKLIRSLAERGSCVVVGRCADYILRNMNPVDCFIYGSLEERISRKMSMVHEGLDFTREEIKKRVIDVDKKRAKYYEFYADRKWGRMEYYDLCINTDKVGIDGAVETILAYLEHCR